MTLYFSNKLLVVTLALILLADSSLIAFAQSDFTQKQVDSGQYNFANSIGLGEGVSADGTSKVLPAPLEYSDNKSLDMSAAQGQPSVLNGCRCVVFKMDDAQDFFVNTVQVAVMDEFTQRGDLISIGPIFSGFGDDPTVVDAVVTGVSSGLFEIFNHGWFHNDFSLESLANQTSHLQLGQDKAELLFGSNFTIFVPPFSTFNNDTLDALVTTGFETISSEVDVDPDPHYIADGVSKILDSRGLSHLPSDVFFINFNEDPPVRISNAQILADIDTSIATRGYAVVTLHPQHIAQTFPNGTFINAPNATLMNDLRTIIDGVHLKNYPIRTFSQVLAFNGTVSIGNVIQAEGNTGPNTISFDVTRSNTSGSMSVDWTTADGTAVLTSDYTADSGTINFEDGGVLTKQVDVTVNGDTTGEPDETFNVDLSNCVGCTIFVANGTATLTNDDLPGIIINDVTEVEGNTTPNNFVFTVTRSSNIGTPSVDFTTSDDTAISPGDFTALPVTTINFVNGGALTQTVTVPVVGDTTIELDETFNVDLSNCIGCTITDPLGVGTIQDDDTVNDLDLDGILDEFDTENIISLSKTITASHIVQDVTVQNGVVLTIPNGVTLIITSGHNLLIQSGSGVLVKSGGGLQVFS
ncbi:MAG TPA: Calx-beta domain-containing protein [Nitrosopumilaceae archaeon]|nr:Calx-beta domain-containing protein [Nitrosopumilaceae archaeon]